MRVLRRLLADYGIPVTLEITRSASYTFRARLASRFAAGRVFLLGDAAHLTPPFIGVPPD